MRELPRSNENPSIILRMITGAKGLTMDKNQASNSALPSWGGGRGDVKSWLVMMPISYTLIYITSAL